MEIVNLNPLGDSALSVTFGNEISLELNERVMAFDAAISAAPFAGFIESVPAYSSLSVFYDPLKIRSSEVTDYLTELLSSPATLEQKAARIIEIPVSFSLNDAPDLASLAKAKNLSVEQVMDIFTSQTYRVFMLGFLPGFSYMGEADERIAMPRKTTPRTRVPKGSIGIAGRQTGVYSLDSPGGWQIIGRTDLEMFLPGENPPSRLLPGDEVRFVAAN